MALEYVELTGGCCSDCASAIANDDYTGMDDAQENATRAGIEELNQWLVVGDELGFTWQPCAVCGGLAGDRMAVGYLTQAEGGI